MSKLWVDNKIAKLLATKPVSSDGSKHVRVGHSRQFKFDAHFKREWPLREWPHSQGCTCVVGNAAAFGDGAAWQCLDVPPEWAGSMILKVLFSASEMYTFTKHTHLCEGLLRGWVPGQCVPVSHLAGAGFALRCWLCSPALMS